MPSFEETIARMKGLYTYGKELNENNNLSTHTLEYHSIGADGKSYGIIKECNKYYIKTAPKEKESIAEAYDYIGGYCNKGNYEYKSYANALKNFEMKLSSINEAFDGNVNVSTLDPFRKENVIVEGTRKMQDEIARCRQIMYNTAMIMNESIETIGATNKDDVVKYNGTNPETPKKNGNSINDGTDAKVVEQDNVKGTGKNHKPGDGSPFGKGSKAKTNEGKCCKKCGKCGDECCCGKNCNEEAGDIGDNPLMPNTENWGTEGIGKGREPKTIGWEMDGQKRVDEETDEWDEGLPGSAGIGTADTSDNNDPFNKSINESDDFDDEEKDLSTDTDFDDGLNDEFSDDEENLPDEGDDFSDEDEDLSDDGDDFSDDESDDFDLEVSNDDEDLSDENDDFNSEEDFSDEGDEFGDEEDFSDEGNEFDDEEDFSDEGDEYGDEEDFSDEGDEYGDEEDFSDEGDEFDDEEGEIDECGPDCNFMNESKARKMNRIIESVTKQILKEEELHDFGRHPGYRKKPMTLPQTGEDENQWGRDWNDDSVHSEEPFGKQIGNGDPFKQLVNAVTKDVMYQLKKGVPIEGMNKKKVD